MCRTAQIHSNISRRVLTFPAVAMMFQSCTLKVRVECRVFIRVSTNHKEGPLFLCGPRPNTFCCSHMFPQCSPHFLYLHKRGKEEHSEIKNRNVLDSKRLTVFKTLIQFVSIKSHVNCAPFVNIFRTSNI